MFMFKASVLAVTFLSGQALAQIGDTCVPEQFYCGSTLLSGSDGNFDLWKGRVDAALTARGIATDGDHEFNSLFFCSNSTTVSFDEFCLATPNNACQPKNAKACSGSLPPGTNQNDCCGPFL